LVSTRFPTVIIPGILPVASRFRRRLTQFMDPRFTSNVPTLGMMQPSVALMDYDLNRVKCHRHRLLINHHGQFLNVRQRVLGGLFFLEASYERNYNRH
jgi:hypothetical protein